MRANVANEDLPEEIVSALRAALNGHRCLSRAVAGALHKEHQTGLASNSRPAIGANRTGRRLKSAAFFFPPLTHTPTPHSALHYNWVHSTKDPMPPSLRDHFLLDPDVIFFNHGSFGACPRPISNFIRPRL